GGAEILDDDLAALRGDLGVLARDHVLDEDDVELAAAADDDLLLRGQRVLAALVLAGDEAQREAARKIGHETESPRPRRAASSFLPRGMLFDHVEVELGARV